MQRWRFTLGLVAACILLPGISLCAEPSADALPDARVRRVFAPADRMDDWPLGSGRYLPVDGAEFDRQLSALQESAARMAASPQVVRATYEARLSEGLVLTGQAVLDIAHKGPRALLSLAPCGLAVSKAVWVGPPSSVAMLGVGNEGRSGVLVDRSGSLRLDWSLRGRPDVSGSVRFELRFPASPVGRLTLDLPDRWIAVATGGIPVVGEKASGGTRRWNLELGGRPRLDLALMPAGSSPEHRDRAVVRQATTYDFTPHGLDVSSLWTIDDLHEPLREVAVALDPGLQLVTARLGNRAVPWFVVSTDHDGSTRLALQLPEGIEGETATLRLVAVAPLVSDRAWRLPRIRAAEMLWEQGSMTLVAAVPMVLERIATDGCRQSSVASLSAPRSGESSQFECFSPDATVEVLVARRQPRKQLTTATTITLGETGIKGQVTADIRLSDGELYALEADVSPQWVVSSVESTPKEILDDWSFDRSEGKPKLRIALARLPAKARSAVVRVEARRRVLPVNRSLTLGELVPLRFEGPFDARRLVSVTTDGPYELKLTGDERLNRLDPRNLDTRERGLFADRPEELLFLEDPGAAGLRIALENRRPRYSGVIRVKAAVADGILYESYSLRCVPESGEIDGVRVHFSHRRDVPIRWSLGNEDEQQLTAKLVSATTPSSGTPATEDEVWELKFRRPRNTPFEITAMRHVPLADQRPISLVSLPEAVSQRGIVTLYCLGPKEVRIKNTRLVPIPAENEPGISRRGFRAAYRYQPSRDIASVSEPALSVAISDARFIPAAWISNIDLQSRFAVDGTGVHVASYRVEGSGGAAVRLVLPPGAQVDDVRVDQLPAIWQRQVGSEGRLSVELPPGDTLHVLSIGFRTKGRPLARMGTLEPLLPQSDLPVFAQDWTVWLPPGYAATDIDPSWRPSTVASLDWRQRLFGALGRPAGWRVWNPLDLDRWLTIGGERSGRADTLQKADLLLQQIGALIATGAARQDEEPLDWGGMLTSDAIRDLPGTVLIDEPSLTRAGLLPRASVAPVFADTPAAAGAILLRQANLALLFDGEAIVLTTQTTAALEHDSLERLGTEPFWEVMPGACDEQIRTALDGDGSNGLLLAEAWNRRSWESNVVSAPARFEGCEPADTSGWTACRLEIPIRSSAQLTYVHRPTLRAFGWISFLMVAAVGWWLVVRSPALVVACLGVFGAAALVLSEALVPFASGGVLGCLFCLTWNLIVRRAQDNAQEDPSHIFLDADLGSTVSGDAPSPARLLLIFAVILAAGSAYGQTAKVKPSQPTVPTYDVFIPVDGHQKPVGGKYYVPEELYRQLNRSMAAVEGRSLGWQIRSVTYRGSLAWQAVPERLAVSELKGIFDLAVVDAPVRVRLPLALEAVRNSADAMLLDGHAMPCQWDGGMLVVAIADPGSHRLELALRTNPPAGANPAGIDLAIPAMVNSRLELNLPAGAPAIEVPTALGEVRREDEPMRLVADLGPTSRLTVTWEERARRSGRTAIDVEELLWMKILPNSIVIDARFRYKVIEGLLREVQVLADPRLRLLPQTKDGAPAVHLLSTPGRTQHLQFELPRTVADQATLEASFLVTGATGVGNLRLPQLDSQGCRVTKRWLAVSLDPGLAMDDRPGENPLTVSVPLFLGDWGTTDSVPQAVYRLTSTQPGWGVAVRPRETRTIVEQTLSISFGAAICELQLDAQLTTSGGACFQHRLLAPPGLEIERASVMVDKSERFARWSAGRDGSLTLFLNKPVTGKHTLSLRARLPVPNRGPLALPLIQLDGGDVQLSTVEVFRRPGCMVKVQKLHGLTEIDTPSLDPAKAELGRLVKTLNVDVNRRPHATVQVLPNQPTIEAQQVIRLQQEGSVWTAATEFEVEVKGGVVDQFQVDVPAPCNGPYRVDPPAKLKVVDVPGEPRRLTIEPPAAINGKYRFTVASPLATEAGDAVSVPNVRLHSGTVSRRIVVVPVRLGSRSLTWETHGLTQLDPKSGAPSLRSVKQTAMYQVRSESFRAVLKSDQAGREPEVSLADVFLDWHDDGTVRGVCTFDVEPGRTADLALWMPARLQWVAVVVGGVPVIPEPQGDRTWRLPLVLGRLPQPVEVLFTGTLQPPLFGTAQRIAVPALKGVPVRQTLWTLVGPPQYSPPQVAGTDPIAPIAGEFLRLKNLATLGNLGLSYHGGEHDERVQWHQLWSQRLAAALAAVQQDQASSSQRGETPTSIRNDLQTAQQQQIQLTRWLTLNNAAPNTDASSPGILVPQGCRWSASPNATVYSIEGPGDGIRISFLPADPQRMEYRWAGAAAMLALAIAALAVARRIRRLPKLADWPVVWGVAGGFAWWLCLTPSFLGWAMILLCIAAALYGRSNRRKTGSTIVISP
jgi:hypothetical protein